MKTDKITKFLLLLIALGLWFNILKPLLPIPVHASKGDVQDVNIVQVGGSRIPMNRVPVELKR
jgi:hypothetical protein